MKKQTKFRVGLFVIIMSSLLLFSCATKPQETEKEIAWRYVNLNPGEFAQWSKERFPSIVTEVIPGEIKYIPDSIFVKGDTIPCPEATENNPKPTVTIPDKYIPITKQECTPGTIKETDSRDLAIRDEDNRKLREVYNECEKSLTEKNIMLTKLQEKVTELSWNMWYGWIAFIILLVFNVVKYFIRK